MTVRREESGRRRGRGSRDEPLWQARRPRRVSIRCASSTKLDLRTGSLDAVFTDPPYSRNIQYGELMNFC